MAASQTTKPIVLFSARFLPNVGGVEFFTNNLGRQLASMGHEVLVVTTEPTDDPAADARVSLGDGSFEVMRLNSWGPKRIPFIKRDRHYRESRARLKALGSFNALINTRFYDLSQMAASLCHRMGVKPVLIDHGTGYIAFPSAILSFAAKTAEHLLTANLRRHPIDFYGVSKDASKWIARFGITSCGEIHNALDADAFVAGQSGRDFRSEQGIAPGTLCVAYAARLLEEKGADAMMEAARLLKDDTRLHFFIAGTGPLEQDVAAAAAELDNLTYVGVLNHPDLAALLLACDVFCLPTRYCEGLPTSLLEAGACSDALVASHAGGVDEIIPSGDYGIILESPTAEAVAGALTSLAEDSERVSLLKAKAHDWICERFTWESTAQEVLKAFSRATC